MKPLDFERMRILVVAPQEPWPLDHGGRLRVFHFVKQLARRAEVTLALPGVTQHAERLPAGVRVEVMTAPERVIACREPSGDGGAWLGRLGRRHFGCNAAIDAWLQRNARPERFDVALFSSAVLGQHVPSARIPAVWDCVDELVLYTLRDAHGHGWRCWPGALRRGLLYALYERGIVRQAAATIFASPIDAAYARRWAGSARVEKISNGVDLAYFRPRGGSPEPGTVAFIGALEFPPNVDAITVFARRVWPQIAARGCGRRLLVVGRRPVAAVRALGALPGVELEADVPDVRPFLTRAAVVVVPTRLGGGVKNKVLEGCAMRRPVVASPRAVAGLSARLGVHVLCAEREAAWVRRVSQLLEYPARAQRVADAGYDWVRAAHRWSALGDHLFDVLASVRAGARRRAAGVTRVVRPGISRREPANAGPAGEAGARAEDGVFGSDGDDAWHDRDAMQQAVPCP